MMTKVPIRRAFLSSDSPSPRFFGRGEEVVPVLLIFGPSFFEPLFSFLFAREIVCRESSFALSGRSGLRPVPLEGRSESLSVGGGAVGMGFGAEVGLADLGVEGGDEGAGLGLTGGVEDGETFGVTFSAFFDFVSLGFVSSGVTSATFCLGNSPAS